MFSFFYFDQTFFQLFVLKAFESRSRQHDKAIIRVADF